MGSTIVITFRWIIEKRPDGSIAQLNNPDTVNASFIPDVDGKYEIKVEVTSGSNETLKSEFGMVEVEASSGSPFKVNNYTFQW